MSQVAETELTLTYTNIIHRHSVDMTQTFKILSLFIGTKNIILVLKVSPTHYARLQKE